MAVYRQLKAAFWESPFVMGLTHEERGFFEYLLLNPATTHSGVYQLSIQMMMAQCTLSEEIIRGLIQKFVTWKKIAYDPMSHEFLLVSWMKHNRPKNPNEREHIGKEVKGIKSLEIKKLWIQINPFDAEKLGLPNRSLTVPEPLGNCLVTVKNQEFKKELSSSVLGSSSVDLIKEVGCSLLGLKQEEPKQEHKDSVSYDQGRDLDPIDLSLREEQPQESSGIKAQEVSNLSPASDPPPEEVIIRYLNRKIGSHYSLDSGSTRKLIQKKLQEGFGVRDFMVVIDKKVEDWQDPKYRSNLIPHVLFGDKFESYLEQCPRNEKWYSSFGQRIPISTFHNHTSEIVEVF